jgi:molybdenum cofactor cytidylyltransferase
VRAAIGGAVEIGGAVDRRFDPPGLAAPSGRVEIVDNPEHLAGVGTSIAAGIRALGDRTAAAMIALGDMPSIDPSTVAALIDAHRETPGLAVAPERGGRRGHPVLFPRAAFADLVALSGDRGARAVFAACPNRAIAVDDPGIFIDIDTPEDLP